MNYKHKILAGAAAFMMAFSVSAQVVPDGLAVSDASLKRNGEYLTATMNLNFPDLKLKHTQAAVFTPMVVNGSDTVRLPSVGVYGRTRYYQTERANKMPLGGGKGIALHYHKTMEPVAYQENIPYESWMNGSTLIVERQNYGCKFCGDGEELVLADVAGYREAKYEPTFIFQEAIAEELKVREIKGRAFVDFPVNLIVIYPDYRNNAVELAKIIGNIDSVKNDKDITVTSLSIKGFASPEGPYDNNVRLAKGRTEALKKYVQQLYKFPEGFITTSYDPEDWGGLREWVVNSNIDNKKGILDIIDSNLAPDPKNTKIEKTYPVQYDYLLKNVYPALRHSDYRIEYTIRQFTNVKEIAEVMKTAPQKLSLNEMYLLASSLEPGSVEYNEVFETAVRMYPTNETANLNAANSAMSRGDYASAERYLLKAGNSPKALYARGVLNALQGNYKAGIDLVEKAIQNGLTGADQILEEMKEAAIYAN